MKPRTSSKMGHVGSKTRSNLRITVQKAQMGDSRAIIALLFLQCVEMSIHVYGEKTTFIFQQSLYDRLKRDKDSEVFFRVFYQYMFEAQQEIKNTIMVTAAEVLIDKRSDDAARNNTMVGRPRGVTMSFHS